MPCLVCITGLSGSGKSTASEFLAISLDAEIVYLGGFVLQEMRARSLSQSAETERIVRANLREARGPAVFAELGATSVLGFLSKGRSVVIDAIFHPAEYDHLKRYCSDFQTYLIAVEAGFDVRSQRLQIRLSRPLSAEDLARRDTYELDTLGMRSVVAQAHQTILNESSVERFREQLERVAAGFVA
jgi:dephospho-CoA kinase